MPEVPEQAHLDPSGYPNRWVADVALADGGTVHIRPVRPDDAELVEAFHNRQSPREHLLPLLQPDAPAQPARARPADQGRLPRPPQPGGAAGRRDHRHGRLRPLDRSGHRRGGLHHRRRPPRPRPGHGAAGVAGGGGPRGRVPGPHRPGAADEPQHARGVPPGGVRVHVELRRGHHRGATQPRAHRRGAGRGRGPGPGGRGPVGRAADQPDVGGGHRGGARAGRPGPRGLPQPAHPRLHGTRLPGQPPGRARGQRAELPDRARHPPRRRPGRHRRARPRGAQRGRPVRTQARPGAGGHVGRPAPSRSAGRGGRAHPGRAVAQPGHAPHRSRVAGPDQHRSGGLVARVHLAGRGARRTRRLPHPVRHAGHRRARARPPGGPGHLHVHRRGGQGRRERQRRAAVLGERSAHRRGAALPRVVRQPPQVHPHRPAHVAAQADRGGQGRRLAAPAPAAVRGRGALVGPGSSPDQPSPAASSPPGGRSRVAGRCHRRRPAVAVGGAAGRHPDRAVRGGPGAGGPAGPHGATGGHHQQLPRVEQPHASTRASAPGSSRPASMPARGLAWPQPCLPRRRWSTRSISPSPPGPTATGWR